MRNFDITASEIVIDFGRRQIQPDETHAVSQGTLRLYRLNHSYIGELYLGTDVLKPGTTIITSKYSYANTNSPQSIANDMMQDNQLTKPDIATISLMASTMGKMGGSAKTEAKAAAARENGKKGGRPKKEAGK